MHITIPDRDRPQRGVVGLPTFDALAEEHHGDVGAFIGQAAEFARELALDLVIEGAAATSVGNGVGVLDGLGVRAFEGIDEIEGGILAEFLGEGGG